MGTAAIVAFGIAGGAVAGLAVLWVLDADLFSSTGPCRDGNRLAAVGLAVVFVAALMAGMSAGGASTLAHALAGLA
jgi:hypothetical protein